MTKSELQQELKEKVKPGTKPSDLRKLKRSKSADDIQPSNPPLPLLQEQLKEKQQEVEELRKKLEETSAKLKETTQALDNSLTARAESLKDWTKQQERIRKLEQELAENVEEASQELISQDQTLVDLRSQVRKLTLTNQQLERDLSLSQRLAGLKDNVPFSYSNPENNLNTLRYFLYSLTALLFFVMLWNSWQKVKYQPE